MMKPINRERRNTLLALIPVIREGSAKGWVQYVGKESQSLIDQIVTLAFAKDMQGAQDWAKRLQFRNDCRQYSRILTEMQTAGEDVTEYVNAFSRALGGRAAIIALESFGLYTVDPLAELAKDNQQKLGL